MSDIVIFLEDMVEDAEFLYPYLRFQEAGFNVISTAPEDKVYTGKRGMSFTPDQVFDNIKDQDFSCVFVPGGYAPDRLRRNNEILQFIRRHYKENKWIAAVCHGGWVLISAGIVKGKKLTGFHAIKDDLINAGANFTGNDMEIDKNLITATNPQTMLLLTKRLIKELQ